MRTGCKDGTCVARVGHHFRSPSEGTIVATAAKSSVTSALRASHFSFPHFLRLLPAIHLTPFPFSSFFAPSSSFNTAYQFTSVYAFHLHSPRLDHSRTAKRCAYESCISSSHLCRCSEFTSEVPRRGIYTPVRVCQACFEPLQGPHAAHAPK